MMLRNWCGCDRMGRGGGERRGRGWKGILKLIVGREKIGCSVKKKEWRKSTHVLVARKRAMEAS